MIHPAKPDNGGPPSYTTQGGTIFFNLNGAILVSILRYSNPGQSSRLISVYAKSVIQYGSVKKIANAVRTEIAYRRKEVFVRSKPYILFVEPLYYCNLDCPLCDRQVFSKARGGDAGKLALDNYNRLLDEIGDYLFQCQIFGQGEPLMNWKLSREIIELSHRRRIFTFLSTNATLISPEMAEDIVASNLDYLVCAIDGVTQKSYEIYRVGGDFEAAMSGLRAVAEARRRRGSNLQIEWQFLVHAYNEHEIPIARSMAEEMGVQIRFAPLCGMEWDAEAEAFWKPKDGPWSKRVKSGQHVNDFPCYFLWRSLVLNSNSKIARCLIYQNASQYYNLTNGSASAAYNHPSVQAARRLFKKAPPTEEQAPAPCVNCGYFARHHGGAIGDRNSAVRQNLDAVSVNR